MSSMLDEVVARYSGATPEQKQELLKAGVEMTKDMLWVPNPGPQSDAYLSKADVLLYGGQAGGGKSQLALGWGTNEAKHGIIFRRELTQTDGLERDGKLIIGNSATYNGTDHEWTWPHGSRSLKLGAIQQADSWRAHAGRERDYMAFDEAGEFLEEQVASLMAWGRAEEGRRVRFIFGSNPPRTAEGLWLIEWFAPWIDDHFPDRAAPGELRWCFYADEKTHWVDGPDPVEYKGEVFFPTSRTFIPASLEDNPFRNTPEYRARLQSLPEPLRSQLLYGKFTTGLADADNQCIPTDWVKLAQERHTPQLPQNVPMCAIGVDVALGGEAQMILAPRFDGYFTDLIKIKGDEIPMERAGSFAAGQIVSHRRDQALIVVDMGGGFGGPLYEKLSENEIDCYAYKGAAECTRTTKDRKLRFVNTRSAAYYQFREALDPDQPGGSIIALPRDNRLLAGLCAPTFEVTNRGIKVEPKDKVVKRLGWSPDEADAVVMSWFEGSKHSNSALDWIQRAEQRGRPMRRQPKVIMKRGPRLTAGGR